MTQLDRLPCDCGQKAVVTPTDSPWEFDISCVCGYRGWNSWAHYKPPPTFQRVQQQQELFDAIVVA